MMGSPRWIFGVLGVLFITLGLVRAFVERRIGPQPRTWLILGVIFGMVAVWLWFVAPPQV